MADPNPPNSLWEVWQQVASSPAAAGAVGGLVRSLVRPYQSWLRNATSTVVGALVAYYAAPTVAVLADRYGTEAVPDPALLTTVGFLLGLVAMSLCDAVIQRVQGWREHPPAAPK